MTFPRCKYIHTGYSIIDGTKNVDSSHTVSICRLLSKISMKIHRKFAYIISKIRYYIIYSGPTTITVLLENRLFEDENKV